VHERRGLGWDVEVHDVVEVRNLERRGRRKGEEARGEREKKKESISGRAELQR